MEDYKKKYEQLTKFIKDLYPFMPDYCKEKTEGMIPELKESEREDERIRKSLIEYINGITSWNYFLGISREQMLTWLEKQGEQKLLNNDKYQTVPVKILDRLYKSEKELEELKQGEQKSASKVEPKFKVGDVISDGFSTVTIDGINKDSYIVSNEETENDANVVNWIIHFEDQKKYSVLAVQ